MLPEEKLLLMVPLFQPTNPPHQVLPVIVPVELQLVIAAPVSFLPAMPPRPLAVTPELDLETVPVKVQPMMEPVLLFPQIPPPVVALPMLTAAADLQFSMLPLL